MEGEYTFWQRVALGQEKAADWEKRARPWGKWYCRNCMEEFPDTTPLSRCKKCHVELQRTRGRKEVEIK